MTLQFRPKTSSDARLYAPNRDLAYCFPGLARVAVYGLNEINMEPWFGEYLKCNGVTDQHLGQTAVALAEAIKLMVDDHVASPGEALAKSGFLDLPTVAQAAVCCKLGQVFLGAFYTCVRDTLPQGAEPPAEIEDLCRAGKEVAQLLEERAQQRAAQECHDNHPATQPDPAV